MLTVNRFLAVLLSLLFIAGTAFGQQQFRFDPERFFLSGDADIDGRMSLDEYQDFMKNSPRIRGGSAEIKRFFDRLDTDRNGFLSLAEYTRPFRRGPRRDARPTDHRAKETSPAEPLTAEQEQFFETKIRPVLVKQCAECHSRSAEDVGAHLYLDSAVGLNRGGDSGPAVVPGQPDRSLLIEALRYGDDLQMPPDEKLPDDVIANFEQWVKMGAQFGIERTNHRRQRQARTRRLACFARQPAHGTSGGESSLAAPVRGRAGRYA